MTVRQYHHEFGNYTDTIVRLGEEEYGQWDDDGRRVGEDGRKNSNDWWF